MRFRLKREHYLNGELKRAGTVIVLKPETGRELVRLGVAIEAKQPASPAARNQK